MPNRSPVAWGSQRIALGALIFHSNTFHFICWAPKFSVFSSEGPFKIFLGSSLEKGCHGCRSNFRFHVSFSCKIWQISDQKSILEFVERNTPFLLPNQEINSSLPCAINKMIMEIVSLEVVVQRLIIAHVSHAGKTLVQSCVIVLKILKDALNGTFMFLWCKRLETDILQCDVTRTKWYPHVCDLILKVKSLKRNKCT